MLTTTIGKRTINSPPKPLLTLELRYNRTMPAAVKLLRHKDTTKQRNFLNCVDMGICYHSSNVPYVHRKRALLQGSFSRCAD